MCVCVCVSQCPSFRQSSPTSGCAATRIKLGLGSASSVSTSIHHCFRPVRWKKRHANGMQMICKWHVNTGRRGAARRKNHRDGFERLSRCWWINRISECRDNWGDAGAISWWNCYLFIWFAHVADRNIEMFHYMDHLLRLGGCNVLLSTQLQPMKNWCIDFELIDSIMAAGLIQNRPAATVWTGRKYSIHQLRTASIEFRPRVSIGFLPILWGFSQQSTAPAAESRGRRWNWNASDSSSSQIDSIFDTRFVLGTDWINRFNWIIIYCLVWNPADGG